MSPSRIGSWKLTPSKVKLHRRIFPATDLDCANNGSRERVGGGAPKGGAPKGGAPKGGGPKFRFFFPSPATISLFLCLSGCLLVEFWCSKRRSPSMCAFGEPKRAHLRVLAFKNTTKIQREDTQRDTKRAKMVAGKGRKRAKFWAVRRRGVQWKGGPVEGGPGKSKPATTTTTTTTTTPNPEQVGPEGPACSPKQGLGFVSLGVGHNNTRQHTTTQNNNKQ